jgi:uncharacterized membrane protein
MPHLSSLPIIGTFASSSGLEKAPFRLLMNLSIPAILFLQFGLAFGLYDAAAETGVRWTMVNVSILSYVLISYLYRNTMTNLQVNNFLVTFMPEILMIMAVLMVALALFHHVHVSLAICLMVGGILCLSFVVVASTLFLLLLHQRLLLLHQQTTEGAIEDEEDDENLVLASVA